MADWLMEHWVGINAYVSLFGTIISATLVAIFGIVLIVQTIKERKND